MKVKNLFTWQAGGRLVTEEDWQGYCHDTRKMISDWIESTTVPSSKEKEDSSSSMDKSLSFIDPDSEMT